MDTESCSLKIFAAIWQLQKSLTRWHTNKFYSALTSWQNSQHNLPQYTKHRKIGKKTIFKNKKKQTQLRRYAYGQKIKPSCLVQIITTEVMLFQRHKENATAHWNYYHGVNITAIHCHHRHHHHIESRQKCRWRLAILTISSTSASKNDWARSDNSVYCSSKLSMPPYDATFSNNTFTIKHYLSATDMVQSPHMAYYVTINMMTTF